MAPPLSSQQSFPIPPGTSNITVDLTSLVNGSVSLQWQPAQDPAPSLLYPNVVPPGDGAPSFCPPPTPGSSVVFSVLPGSATSVTIVLQPGASGTASASGGVSFIGAGTTTALSLQATA